MSDLKHQTVAQLRQSRIDCVNDMNHLKSRLAGQQQRLEWIEKYLYEKTPQELSIAQIESKLGHRIIIKSEL